MPLSFHCWESISEKGRKEKRSFAGESGDHPGKGEKYQYKGRSYSSGKEKS